MGMQAKYNMYKGLSTSITFLTPIVTACCFGEFWDSPERSMSTTAIFAILISLFFLKDKLAEQFKSPTALVIALLVFTFCVVASTIIKQLEIVSIATIIACGVDEATFKRFYKNIERMYIDTEQTQKTCGFITKLKLKELKEDNNVNTK